MEENTNRQEERKALLQEKLGRFNSITIEQLKKVAKKTPKEALLNFGDLFVEGGNYVGA